MHASAAAPVGASSLTAPASLPASHRVAAATPECTNAVSLHQQKNFFLNAMHQAEQSMKKHSRE